jgi:hypothetical protein
MDLFISNHFVFNISNIKPKSIPLIPKPYQNKNFKTSGGFGACLIDTLYFGIFKGETTRL